MKADNNISAREVSRLGFGVMRLPKGGGKIDMAASEKLIEQAVELGINYFDTAYIYPGSEAALGEILQKNNLRNRVNIATKLPTMLCRTPSDFDKYFNIQLERLRTGRVDYYLLHMLIDIEVWNRLCSMGIREWIARKKASGEIINIGFSYHGGKDEFKLLIDGFDWDFCMIQYNYLDEHNQAGVSGLQYAHAANVKVFIMEPLRGGALTHGLPEDAAKIFAAAKPNWSAAEWGLRWLFDQPEVAMVLSGMNQPEQITENWRIMQASTHNSLSGEDMAVYQKVLAIFNASHKVPCTACSYCMPCPFGVDIPSCFFWYNQSYSAGYFFAVKKYFMNTGFLSSKRTDASNCTGCGACLKHCPQSINISAEMPRIDKRMRPIITRPVWHAAKKLFSVKKNHTRA